MSEETSDLLGGGLYPEIAKEGDLASVMASLATRSGINLGVISARPGAGGRVTAEVASDKGSLLVQLGAESRWFFVTLIVGGRVWASGGSVDLIDIIRVAELWRMGVGVEGLLSQYPFMVAGELALEFDQGDPVAVQWKSLLSDPDLVDLRPLLLAAHKNHLLTHRFPYVTHLTMLRIMRDHRDRAAGEVWITWTSGIFRVEDPRKDLTSTALTAEEAVLVAASLI